MDVRGLNEIVLIKVSSCYISSKRVRLFLMWPELLHQNRQVRSTFFVLFLKLIFLNLVEYTVEFPRSLVPSNSGFNSRKENEMFSEASVSTLELSQSVTHGVNSSANLQELNDSNTSDHSSQIMSVAQDHSQISVA